MTTSFAIKITDKDGNFPHTFNVTRLDYNWSGQIKNYAVVSTPGKEIRGTPRFFDFGRQIEGLVIYGWMDSWDDVMSVRDKLNGVDADSDDEDDNGGNWWMNRPCRFYVTSSSYHTGMVADFKAYNDRMTGGEKAIKYVLTYVIASKFSDALP